MLLILLRLCCNVISWWIHGGGGNIQSADTYGEKNPVEKYEMLLIDICGKLVTTEYAGQLSWWRL